MGQAGVDKGETFLLLSVSPAALRQQGQAHVGEKKETDLAWVGFAGGNG